MLTVLIYCFPMTYLLFSFHYDLYHKIGIHQYYSQDQIFQSTTQTISPTQHNTTQHNTQYTTQHSTTQHNTQYAISHCTTLLSTTQGVCRSWMSRSTWCPCPWTWWTWTYLISIQIIKIIDSKNRVRVRVRVREIRWVRVVYQLCYIYISSSTFFNLPLSYFSVVFHLNEIWHE